MIINENLPVWRREITKANPNLSILREYKLLVEHSKCFNLCVYDHKIIIKKIYLIVHLIIPRPLFD